MAKENVSGGITMARQTAFRGNAVGADTIALEERDGQLQVQGQVRTDSQGG